MESHQAPSGRWQPARAGADDTAQIPALAENPRPLRPVREQPAMLMRVPVLHFSLVSVVTLLLMASIGIAALGREISPEGTLPPGVQIAGVYVGGMDLDEARGTLEARLSGYVSAPLSLSYEDQIWNPTLAELGGEFDLDQTLAAAQFEPSRSERVRTRVFGPTTSIIPLRLSLDRDALDDYVASVASEIDQEPQVPQLTLRDGQLMLASAKPGVAVEQETLSDTIYDAVFSLDRSPIAIPAIDIEPEFNDEDVQAIGSVIRDAVGGPITITFEGQNWSLTPEVLAEHLTLRQGDDGVMEIAFHEDELFAYLDGLIGDINRSPVNARVAWGGSGVVATSPSQDGIERNLGAIFPLLEEAIATGGRQVELPVNRVKPVIDSNNLDALGIETLVSQGESAFWNSSPSRAHNIAVAASYLDGTLIPPGTEFSFNSAIGEISVDRGYQEGYVILAEQTAPGIGGGVCQVSTTMFRAAFFSGLPITERHPHAYIVGFYEDGGWPLGFDAAIYQPHTDFRFMNSTDSYLLIHTAVVDQKLYINIYGPDLGYDVTLGEAIIQNETAPPEDVNVLDESLGPGQRVQVEWAKPGIEVTLPRIVRNRDGEIVRQDYFYSNFQPWGNRFLVGPSPTTQAESPETAPVPDPPSGEIIEETSESDAESSSD